MPALGRDGFKEARTLSSLRFRCMNHRRRCCRVPCRKLESPVVGGLSSLASSEHGMQMVHRALRTAARLDAASPRYLQYGARQTNRRGCSRPLMPRQSSRQNLRSISSAHHDHGFTSRSPLVFQRRHLSGSSPAADEARGMETSPAQTSIVQKLRNSIAALQLYFQPVGHNASNPNMSESEETQTNGVKPPTLAQRMPAGAWDSHMHVFDLENYELIPNAIYRPNSYSLAQAMDFEATVGLHNIVLVQPSIYGNDNACLLDALRELGPEHGRGVVSFDPDTTSLEQLQEWHELGVRGARFNVQSSGRTLGHEQLSKLLHKYADAVRPLNWVVQAYVPMHLIDLLEPIIPTLNVKFCIDHIGHPTLKGFTSTNPYDLPGFKSLVKLLEGGHTYVKLSAPYRTSQREDNSDIAPFAREIIRLKGTSRVVFATDWPHTRYEGLDIRPWMETVFEWCGDDNYLVERLFKANAEDLWDVPKN